jgi:phosphate-selective porin
MLARFASVLAALAVLCGGWGCASSGHSPNDDALERRVSELERDLAAQRAAQVGAPAPAAPVAAAETKAATPPAPDPAGQRTASGGSAGPAPVATLADVAPFLWQVTPEISFKPGLRIQTRFVHDGGSNNNDIALQRFRLKAAGNAWKAKWATELKIDGTGRTGANPSAAVENAWIDYPMLPYLISRAGLYDVPFSRDALTSDSKLLFMDRSLIKDALTSFGLADNGIGAMVRGRPFEGRFEYALGVFNNDRFDGLGTKSRRSGSVMPIGRLAVDLLDPASAEGYADYKASYIGQGRRLSIGANAGYLGDAESDLSGGGLEEFDLYALGTDLFFNWGPYTLQAEYDFFRQTGDVDHSNSGWYVQGGYLLEPLNRSLDEVAPWLPDLELAVRYQDADAKAAFAQREHRTSIGMNAYIYQHNLKLQTDLSFRHLEDSADSKLYQLQLQLDF